MIQGCKSSWQKPALHGAEPGGEGRIAALCTDRARARPAQLSPVLPRALTVLGHKPFIRGKTHPFFFTHRAFCTGKTSTEDENFRPTKRLCHLRQIRHLHGSERETSTLGGFSEDVLQERMATKYEVCKAEGNKESVTGITSIIAGAQNQPPGVPSGQRGTGAAGPGPCCRSCWDTAQKAFVRALTRGQGAGQGFNPTHPHMAGTQTRQALSPRVGLEPLLPLFTIFNCPQSRGAARQEPALHTEPEPSHCPQTMRVPSQEASRAPAALQTQHPPARDSGNSRE